MNNINLIAGIKNCRYDLKGNIFFEDYYERTHKIPTRDALKIAYTLFDSVGHSYKELDEINEELI
ncbi:MAG: hypothetical protein K2P14_10440 [Anaeroplasmataceae bacterium]|nr:hypothetical protein [Anaeroplasmataceae bacterium]